MVRLDLVHRTMERATATNILFLDACRNNPLARNLARAMGTRSAEIGRGLAAVESGVGTLISFSTQPGNVALDGTGRNSPFAGSLVKRIATSSDDLSALLIDVRNDVRKETQGKQVPWEHSALTGRFYFNPAAVPAAAKPAIAPEPQRIEPAKATPERDQRSFDGIWKVDRKSANCRDKSWNFSFQVKDGVIQGSTRVSKITGSVSASGELTLSHTGTDRRTGRSDGKVVFYSGSLKDDAGSGTFFKGAGCSGNFTASRLAAPNASKR
jgi:hypothetical protein